MNKREKTEVTSREKKTKRIKTHVKPNLLAVVPVTVDCFKLEEQENSNVCQEKSLEVFEAMRLLFQSMNVAKKEKNETYLNVHKPNVCMLVMQLKKLNRLDKHQWKKSRDIVNERKQKVDAVHLHYQNLLYEATHLQKEVNKCLEFRSFDEGMDFVPVEQFYRDAPESISKPEITKNDIYELTMARLIWESEQRKMYSEKIKEREITKQEYNQTTKKLQENLSIVVPIMKSIIEAAEPFQNKMGMPFQAMHSKHKYSKYLPRPLYVLYVQANAYKDNNSRNKIEVSIVGNIDDVKVLQINSRESLDESGESDQEDGTTESSNRRHTNMQKKDGVNKDVLMKHPMSVILTIAKESEITLEFKYLIHLHIVTVTVKSINPEPMSTDLIGDLLKFETFLNCLFPGDTGKESPNLESVYRLRSKFGFDGNAFTNDTTGLPYVWVQQISGMEFLSPNPDSKVDSKPLFRYVPSKIAKTMAAIGTRLVSRYQLYQQITSLEQRIIVPPTFASLYPHTISSQLKNWSPAPWNDISKHVNSEDLTNLNIVNEDAMLYKAELQRGSATLSLLVCIHPEFPSKSPLLLLKLFWKGTHDTASSWALRELEEEVNVHFVESLPAEFKDSILVCQLYHLAVCFDVFLETESSGDSFEGPCEFVRENVVVRFARGCSRSRPYKCISSQGIFTYR